MASVTLARLYMKRVTSELDQTLPVKETVREFMLLQGVRFAFRVHKVFHSLTDRFFSDGSRISIELYKICLAHGPSHFSCLLNYVYATTLPVQYSI